jgi:hypothetical protein
MHKLSMKQLVTLSSKRFFMIPTIIAKFPKTEIKMITIKYDAWMMLDWEIEVSAAEPELLADI